MKLSAFLLVICVSLFQECFAQSNFVLDSKLQQLLIDKQKFEGDSGNEVLQAFLKWYNSIMAAIDMVYDPAIASNNQLFAACKGFPVTRLTRENQQKFQAVCPLSIEQYLSRSEETTKSIAPHADPSSTNEFGRSMSMIFQVVEETLMNLMGAYGYRKNCTAPHLTKFLPVWKSAVKNIIAKRTEITNSIPGEFKNSMAASSQATTALQSLTSRVTECRSSANMNACISKLFSDKIECYPKCKPIDQLVSSVIEQSTMVTAKLYQGLMQEENNLINQETMRIHNFWSSIEAQIQNCMTLNN